MRLIPSIIAALALATNVAASTSPIPANFTLPPLRPTVVDTAFNVLSAGYPYKWYPLNGTYVPSTQTAMDALTESALVNNVNMVRMVRSIPNNASTTDFMLSDSQGISAMIYLNVVYEGNFGNYRGTWTEDWTGSDYQKNHYLQRKVRKFLLANPVAAANAVEVDRWLPFLNLAKVNGKVVDAYAGDPPFPESMTSVQKLYKNIGIIDYDHKQPPLTPEQIALLQHTHELHHQQTDYRCGVGTNPTESVDAAHQAFEASARNETEHHFFVMKRFSGDVDPRWSTAQVCAIARNTDTAHHKWMDALIAGSWAASRKAENDHQQWHFVLNLQDPRLLLRFDCGSKDLSDCHVGPWQDFLK